MKMKCIIIDDEPLARKIIENYLGEVEELELQKSFDNPMEALNFLKETPTDLIFLDVDMAVMDGLSFLKTLESPPKVILITAHSQYAVESYELDVSDYLLKPVSFPRFLKAVQKVIKKEKIEFKPATDVNHRPYLFVKVDKKKLQKIYLDEIVVVESLKDYIKIVTDKARYVVHQTLSNFTGLLPEDQFLRIHRSYTIALDKIDAVEANSVQIRNQRYTIGRSYLSHAREIILQGAVVE